MSTGSSSPGWTSHPVAATGGHQTAPFKEQSHARKVLAWEDAAGVVWVGYTAPADLVARHQIGDRADVVQKMTGVLDALTTQATKP